MDDSFKLKKKIFMDNDRLKDIKARLSFESILAYFGITIDQQRGNKLKVRCPWTGENTPSLEINLDGHEWHTFSGVQKGGSPLDLLSEILKSQGQDLDIYNIGRWVIEKGLVSESSLASSSQIHTGTVQPIKEEKKNNPEISTDLRKFLKYSHPELEKRGITEKTARSLGLGYLPYSPYPVAKRLCFAINGIRPAGDGLEPYLVGFGGRAINETQENADGKYWYFPFSRNLEILGQDRVLLEPAREQARASGHLLLVEGIMDLAGLHQAGILNAVSPFSAHLDEKQIPRLRLLADELKINKILVFFDRDKTGSAATIPAVELLKESGFNAVSFDWNQTFSGGGDGRESVAISESVKDPGDFTEKQLKFLQKQGKI